MFVYGFWIGFVWVIHQTKDNERTFHLCSAVSGYHIVILTPYLSWIHVSIRKNISWSDRSILWYQNLKILFSTFPVNFSPGIPCQQELHTGIQSLYHNTPLFIKYHKPLNDITCVFHECGNWLPHLMAPVIHTCYIPMFLLLHRRMLSWYTPSDSFELIHISESVFCEKEHNLLQNFTIFLPAILWYIIKIEFC